MNKPEGNIYDPYIVSLLLKSIFKDQLDVKTTKKRKSVIMLKEKAEDKILNPKHSDGNLEHNGELKSQKYMSKYRPKKLRICFYAEQKY